MLDVGTQYHIWLRSVRKIGNQRGLSDSLLGQQCSETVWTFEAAYRLQSPDNRYTLSTTVFYSRYEDLQFFLETQPGNRFSLQVVNLPEGETRGLELEGRVAVSDDLVLFGGLGLLRTKITESTATSPQLQGDRFGKDPEFTGNAGFIWTPAAVNGLTLDGKLSDMGEVFNDFNNVTAEQIGDYALVDIGASYVFRAFEIRACVNNLFDQTGTNQRVGGFSAVTSPRTLGIAASARF